MSDTLIWLGLWALILWGVGHLRQNLLLGRIAKIAFLPGVALEALIRALACFVTGTPIEKFRPFESGAPFLTTGRCPVARIGVPITMAIRMAITFVVALVLLQLGTPSFTESGFGLPTFLYHREGIAGSSGGFLASFVHLPGTLGLGTLAGWLVVYTLFSLALATGLSAGEFFAALWGWGGIFVASWLLGWLGVRLDFLSPGWFLQNRFLPPCWASFSLLVTLSLVALVFVLVLHALPNVATRLKPKPTGTTQGLAVGQR